MELVHLWLLFSGPLPPLLVVWMSVMFSQSPHLLCQGQLLLLREITVSYNIQYNVTIRAENCAGSSQNAMVVFDLGKYHIIFAACCF